MSSAPPSAKRSKTSHSSSSQQQQQQQPPWTSAAAGPPTSHRGVSMTQPLIEGLSRKPIMANHAVQAALVRLEAARRIARWIVEQRHRQSRGKRGGGGRRSNKTTTTTSLSLYKTTATPLQLQQQQHPPPADLSSHWLWDAMKSASRAERHVAARLLLQGGCPCSTCRSFANHAAMAGSTSPFVSFTNTNLSETEEDTDGKNNNNHAQDEEYRLWQLQSVLCALWNQHIQAATAGTTTTTTNATTSHHGMILTSPTVPMEWMALLKHVLLGKLVTEERLMAFCFRGIPWMSRSIWQLVTQLASTSSSSDGSKSNNAACAPTQLQALVGLVELCYSLLLVVFCEPPSSNLLEATTTTKADTAGGTQGPLSSPTATTRRPPAAAATSAGSNRRNQASNARTSSSTAAAASSSNRMSSSTTTAATPTTAAATTSEAGRLEDITKSPAVMKRLALRRRLLKRLFWKSHELDSNNATTSTTTSKTNSPDKTQQQQEHQHLHHYHAAATPLSPLACLIGAFHIWKTNTDWPYPGPTVDACLTMLKQLVDPTSTAKAVSLAGLAGLSSSSPASSPQPSPAANHHKSGRSRSSSKRRKRARSASAESGNNINNNAFANIEEDEEEDVIMEDIVDQDDDDDDDEDDEGDDSPVEVVVHDEDEHDETANNNNDHQFHQHHDHNNDEDEEIDSDDEQQEQEETEDPQNINRDDDYDDDDSEADDDDEDEDDDDSDEDGDGDGEIEGNNTERHERHLVLHDEDVADLEEGFLELNEGGEGAMALELEDLVGPGSGSAASGLVMSSAARSRLQLGGDDGGAGASSAPSLGNPNSNNAAEAGNASGEPNAAVVSDEEVTERKQLCLYASMQVLAVQHPPLHPGGYPASASRSGSRAPSRSASPAPHLSLRPHNAPTLTAGALSSGLGHQPKCFSLAAEQSLLESVMSIVRPPKKPVNIKMIMRRAPTQEEFFRGSLSRNPISLSMLKASGGSAAPSAPGEIFEPTVADLRQHIAKDLQMAESAELLELLVANKILDVKLKLRVVHQVLWKNHLMEHNHPSAAGPSGSSGSALASFLASGGGAPSFFSTGSGGLSMMFNSGLGGINVGGRGGSSGALGRGSGGQGINADTPLAALPPLVVTYRLAGVDGEATEDTVSQLTDPEAPSDEMSPAELDQLMEKEYGITRIVAEGRGVYVLLRSIEHHIQHVLRGIRRDDISVLMEFGTSKTSKAEGKNMSRNKFKTQAPYPGLSLLICCAKLPSNRKKLLQARAPTVLLRLLLDVLNALEDPQAKSATDKNADVVDSGSNPTAEILQELIEALASDISTTADGPSSKPDSSAMDEGKADETASTTDSMAAAAEGQDQDATTLSLVLSSLETISLSPPLRNIIAKLLPFLTYGQSDLSRELALNFSRHIDVNAFVDDDSFEEVGDAIMEDVDSPSRQEKENQSLSSPGRTDSARSSVLMDAFVQASKTLPPNEVCNTLRLELINCGFIRLLANFVTKGVPSLPPPWSAALWPHEESMKATSPAISNKKKQALIKGWRDFFLRQGIKTAFDMLIGLCKHHPPTQTYISQIGQETDKGTVGSVPFLEACHWMEATSDSASNRVYVRGIGLLAETLMDEVMDGNDLVAQRVNALRRKTRLRKKEIAEARRSKALINMGVNLDRNRMRGVAAGPDTESPLSQSASGVRGTAASFLAPVLGFFRDSSSSPTDATARNASAAASTTARTSPRKSSRGSDKSPANSQVAAKKPAWMAEMEALDDEQGLLCAVCQEGRTLQPSELLGLYAYVKKVSIPPDQCGSRESIDGTTLLRSLPNSTPESLVGSHAAEWLRNGKSAGDALRESHRSALSLGSSMSSRRNTYFTTTVSAGNAIHFSCHQRARQADRNHPKAPKSEWEGAILRNSRVNCNVILPLVSSRSSDVPLVAVDSALTEYQTAVNNLTGSAPKSMLWTVLHDIRFLLLRMAHGEFLNADCGGGSLASNTQLLMYQLMMADMFEKDAQIDAPETSQHVRNLSAGFLAACSIVHAEDYKPGSATTASIMMRGIADSAPMAGLTCILAHNNGDDFSSTVTESSEPNPKRRWLIGKEHFLRGLLICAGRRHALGLEGSGCTSGRGSNRPRSSSLNDWDMANTESAATTTAASASSSRSRKSSNNKRATLIDDFGQSLRPMLILFAILDKLSSNFSLNLQDTDIEEASQKIVKLLERCQAAENVRELLEICNADFLDHEAIMEDFQNGLKSA